MRTHACKQQHVAASFAVNSLPAATDPAFINEPADNGIHQTEHVTAGLRFKTQTDTSR